MKHGGEVDPNTDRLTTSYLSALQLSMPFAGSTVRFAVPAEVHSSAGGESDPTALALAARTLDPGAMRTFLEAIAPSVRNVCRGVLGAGHVDLEDTVQECLIEILRALPKYRVEGAIVHYTNRIALRASIAARKRARSREQRLRTLAEQAFVPNLAEGDDSLPNLWLVRALIDELSAVQAETVLMRMVLGCSVEEIAVATQVPVNTTKSRLRLAKDYLRRRLDGEAGGWKGRA
jgi:RNA polymerase sigma factor (sigma-70 family)